MENIWNFADNEGIETDKIEMKSFKPTGKFAEDVQFLLRHFNVKCHPALRDAGCSKAGVVENKDLTTLNFQKFRLDRNSARITFIALQHSPNIQTLK